MPPTELSFDDVVDLLDDVMGGAFAYVGFHGAFWRGKTRDEFVASDPIRNITPVIVGDGAGSGLVQALRGTGPFDPETGEISRMPQGGPYMADADIDAIAQWIDAGCPE